MKKSFLGIIILVVLSCSQSSSPDGVMDESAMINYLIDLHLAEAAVQDLRLKKDSAEIVFAAQEKLLLKTHHITDSMFVKSYTYYLERPEEFEAIYSAIVDSLSLRQVLLREDDKQ